MNAAGVISGGQWGGRVAL